MDFKTRRPHDQQPLEDHQNRANDQYLTNVGHNSLLIREVNYGIFPTETGTLESTDKPILERNAKEGKVKDEGSKVSQSMEATSLRSVYTKMKAQKGICFILISSLCYALLGVLIQLATSIDQLEAGVARGIFLVVFSTFGLFCSSGKVKVPRGDTFWIVILSVLNALAQVTSFTAYSFTSVGNASAIMFSIPALSGVMAWAFLKERLTVYDSFATAVCLFGVFMVSKPPFLFPSEDNRVNGATDNHFMGSVWAAITLVVLSTACVITRKLSYSSEYVYILTFGHGILATIASVLLNSFIGKWSWPNGVVQVVYVMGLGVVGFYAIYFYNLSLQTEKALVVSVLFTSSIFMSYVFQFALFKDFPDVVVGVGIVLLLLSVIAIFSQKWRLSREQSRDANMQ